MLPRSRLRRRKGSVVGEVTNNKRKKEGDPLSPSLAPRCLSIRRRETNKLTQKTPNKISKNDREENGATLTRGEKGREEK